MIPTTKDQVDLKTLSEQDVLDIRYRIATTTLAQRAFGGVDPIRPDQLSSAVARQTTGYGRQLKYTRTSDVAATLFYGLCMNHAFENGNKRTALVSMLIFLELNDLLLVDTTEDDLFDLATRTADHALAVEGHDAEVGHIGQWLAQRTRKESREWRQMRFRDLRKTLEELGCTFDSPSRNFIKIHRITNGKHLSIKTGYPNEHIVVPPGDFRRIRERLHLDDVHGYDAGSVYDLAGSVDSFVNKYGHLMDRLADM